MSMPQIRAALGGWTQRMHLVRREQSVINGLVQNNDRKFSFQGTVQPLSPKEIMLKPEGQRAWTWLQIHCLSNSASIIQPNDIILINNEKFKVMGQNDYSLNGYIEYHVVRDFQC